MPDFCLNRIYLGNDKDAEELLSEVSSTVLLNNDKFASRNAFVKHCIIFTLEHDRELRHKMERRRTERRGLKEVV